MSEFVERIALAIARADKGRPVELDFLRAPATGGAAYMKMAHAALQEIEAIRAENNRVPQLHGQDAEALIAHLRGELA